MEGEEKVEALSKNKIRIKIKPGWKRSI